MDWCDRVALRLCYTLFRLLKELFSYVFLTARCGTSTKTTTSWLVDLLVTSTRTSNIKYTWTRTHTRIPGVDLPGK